MDMIGKIIRIIYMDGEPRYAGREGEVTSIDDMGQLHGLWGSLAVIPNVDIFEIVDTTNEGTWGDFHNK